MLYKKIRWKKLIMFLFIWSLGAIIGMLTVVYFVNKSLSLHQIPYEVGFKFFN